MQTQAHTAVGGRTPFEGWGESFSFILSVGLVCFRASCLSRRGPGALLFHRVVGGGSVDVWWRSRFGARGGCREDALCRRPCTCLSTERKLANIRSSSVRGVSLQLLASSRPSPVSRLRLREDLEFPFVMRNFLFGKTYFSLRFCVFYCRGG
ncbi:hypothetical protein B0H14DRAFT_767144 [Mycena olivaceomarginata]|nr:hypothetical protein B0H14DRAFT_767144 [Mycena olivaceomarginata]